MSKPTHSSENDIHPNPISVENQSTTEIPPGYYKITKGKLIGYKYFYSCEPVQTFTQWLKTGFGRYPQTYSGCIAKVTVDEGSEFVRPIRHRYNYDDRGSEYRVPSMDFRANKYHVGDIITPDGKKCVSAQSPFRNMMYHPNQTYTSELATTTSYECEKGLHFYPTEEILKSYTQGQQYCIDTKNKSGTVIGTKVVNYPDNQK